MAPRDVKRLLIVSTRDLEVVERSEGQRTISHSTGDLDHADPYSKSIPGRFKSETVQELFVGNTRRATPNALSQIRNLAGVSSKPIRQAITEKHDDLRRVRALASTQSPPSSNAFIQDRP